MDDRNRNEEFIRLFLPVERRVYAYIRSMVFNRADAEDLLQEVAATLWRSFDQFEPGTHFDRWALTAALNQVRYFRQKHRRNVLAFSEPLFETIAQDGRGSQRARRRLHGRPDGLHGEARTGRPRHAPALEPAARHRGERGARVGAVPLDRLALA